MAEAMEEIREARPRRFRPYPEYRESGVEWLGAIPAAWAVDRLKHLAAVQLSSVDKKKEEGEALVHLCNYVDVYYNDEIRPEIEFMEATASEEEIRRFSLAEGDVLITKDSESWDDIAVPAYVGPGLDGIVCGYHLAHIRPDRSRLLGSYLGRAFSAAGVRDQFRAAATGITRFGLSKRWIDGASFPVPSVAEQRAIASFLDRETAKIDGLVAKKERLIELLQEKRTARITRAVTQGLDPNIPMKDSGVEWLGKIPAHWEVMALKRIGSLKAGAGFPDVEQGLLDEELPFFKVGDMGMLDNHREMRTWQHSVSHATARRLGAFVFSPGTIVFAKVGAALLLNRRRLLAVPSCFDNNMMGFTPAKCDHDWALYWLSGLDMGELANPGAVPSVNEGQMSGTPALVPPLEEQRAIARFLDTQTIQIDALMSKVREAIAHLKEFRTALISAAVTGKIDVRAESA